MEAIDQVRQAADIVSVASLYTALKRRGRKHVGLCPFHSEKDPSFTVDAEKQLYHCFGCGAGGDVFTLVMEKENLSFPEALHFLAERFHVTLPPKKGVSPALVRLEEKIFKVNELALAFFRRQLFQTPEGETALGYLRTRGFSRETIETLRIGYAPNSWNALVEYFRGTGIAPPLVEQAGLALPGKKRGESYDRFRGRVIFPIFSLTGKLLGFGGRTIVSAEPKYLNSPDTPVYSKGRVLYGLNWTKESIQEAGEAILVEGYTDFASLFQAGIRNVVASLGTALTPNQMDLLRRFSGNLIINYDGDAAGQAAALRAIPIGFQAGISTRVLVLPGNLDPDRFIVKSGPQAYLKLARESVPALKFLVAAAVRTGRMDVPEEKTRIVRSVVAEIEKIPDSLVRSEYLRQASELLSVDEILLRRIVEKRPQEKGSVEKPIFLPAEKRLLQILLGNPESSAPFLDRVQPDDFKGIPSEPVFRFILNEHRKGKKVTLPEIVGAVGKDVCRQIFQAVMEKARPGTAEEAFDCLTSLRKTFLQARLQALQKEIIRCEKSGQKDELRRLLSQKQHLTRQIMTM